MKKAILVPLVIVAISVTTAVLASADPLPPLQEVPDPVPALPTILATETFGPLDVDPVSLVVTDEELADAGPTPAVVTLSSTPALVVDDDLAQCPDADFTTAAGIQLAVGAASPGDTIRVCPGVYTPVEVTKSVQLEAPRHQGQATQCQAPVLADPTRVAIVEGSDIFGVFYILANDVGLRGFTIQNNDAGPGIQTTPATSGYVIEHNVVQQNVFGAYLHSSGTVESLARHNCFRDNNAPGSASGNGIYSDQGASNLGVDDNFFTQHENAAVIFAGLPGTQSGIRVRHNSAIDDRTIYFFHVTDSLISHNRIERPMNGSGIFIGGGVTNVEISYNSLRGGPTSARGITMRTTLDEGISTLPNTNNVVARNRVEDFPLEGIRLGLTTTDNIVRMNRSHNNGTDGLKLTDGATSNLIEKNHMRFNAEHDCHDDLPNGSNQWVGNHGETQNEPGLCKKAAVV